MVEKWITVLPRHKTIFLFLDSWKQSKPEADAHRGEFSRHIEMSIVSRSTLDRQATTISIARRPTVDRWPIDRDHRPSVQKILLIHRLNFTAVLWTLDRLYVVPRPTYLAATRSTYRPMYLSICRSLIGRHSTDTTLVSLTLDQLSVVGWYIYI